MNFESKNVVVIGGSSGIGRGIASSFIEKGADVCITGTRESIADYDEEITENIKKCVYSENILQLEFLASGFASPTDVFIPNMDKFCSEQNGRLTTAAQHVDSVIRLSEPRHCDDPG